MLAGELLLRLAHGRNCYSGENRKRRRTRVGGCRTDTYAVCVFHGDGPPDKLQICARRRFHRASCMHPLQHLNFVCLRWGRASLRPSVYASLRPSECLPPWYRPALPPNFLPGGVTARSPVRPPYHKPQTLTTAQQPARLAVRQPPAASSTAHIPALRHACTTVRLPARPPANLVLPMRWCHASRASPAAWGAESEPGADAATDHDWCCAFALA